MCRARRCSPPPIGAPYAFRSTAQGGRRSRKRIARTGAHCGRARLERMARSGMMPPTLQVVRGIERMWEIVRAGGPLMWPIILCSIAAAAIVLERLWTLQDKRVLPRELPQKVWQLIESNQVNDKVISALEQNSPLGRLLATGRSEEHT